MEVEGLQQPEFKLPQGRRYWWGPAHLYLRPHPLLRDAIAHYTVIGPWLWRAPEQLTLIPDASGCLIFTPYPGPFEAQIWGPTTRTVEVVNNCGAAPVRVFVEFRPGGMAAILGLDTAEVTDLRLPLSQVLPGFTRLAEQLFSRPCTLEVWMNGLDELLLKSCPGEMERYSAAYQALRRLQLREGSLPVRPLAEELGYSVRQLERLFTSAVGLGLKQYSGLLRVNRALRLLKCPAIRMTDLAQSLGYYDQSHFVRDFRRICGVAPTQFLQKMSGFYNEDDKF